MDPGTPVIQIPVVVERVAGEGRVVRKDTEVVPAVELLNETSPLRVPEEVERRVD